MVIVKATPDSEAGLLPDQKLLTEMGKFNDELVKADEAEDFGTEYTPELRAQEERQRKQMDALAKGAKR